jgi:hypothetical protein
MDEAELEKKIIAILDNCEYTDYAWDGENEVGFTAFAKADATRLIIEFLKTNNLLKI